MNKLASTDDAEKVIDGYLNNLDEYIKNTYVAYKDKVKKDKNYEAVTSINDDTKKITYKKFLKEKYLLQIELLKLQEWLKNTNKTVIVVFEGRDSAGKGSTIKKFTEHLNPRYYKIIALGVPTPKERKN